MTQKQNDKERTDAILDDFAEWVDGLVSDGWIVKKLVQTYKKEKRYKEILQACDKK